MKKILSLVTLALVLVFSSCIEQDYPLWDGSLVEFQDAVVRTPVAGQKYPRITVNNKVGTVSLQVNLVAPQRSTDETINYSVVAEGTTAVAGTDYTTAGTLVIPANSSVGTLTINVVNTGSLGGSVDLLLQLDGNATISPSENYKQVQIRITR
ncbi:Calx-beta domain-containing protein [Algoriphagus boseongensis]|uniref:Calx-beta domain-containing protein n=1 Tax=Algoriphagus boseongensis TaxID=1442587 RepID=A0A4R6T690_9BACT|nr:Calx-beta domain-containing protein [Algoriphagus boseongensis]TDQ15276.1 Calx-beta domain-containing protein [Algoriphagus boseongensis]